MATGELRERVRDRLVSAELGLARALAGVAPPADDRVLAAACRRLRRRGGGAAAPARRRRLGLRRRHDRDHARLLPARARGTRRRRRRRARRDVRRGPVRSRRGGRRRPLRAPLPPRRAAAVRPGRGARGSAEPRSATHSPASSRSSDAPATRRRRGRCGAVSPKPCATEVETRKRRSGVMTYDDLLTRLRNTLADEEHGAAACARLREQYRVALVDEFQDTDPIQWEIMRRAFGEGEATLILIGDPKQAVYSFRGADVYAYLSAADSAVTKATLATNWRSDQGLIDALDALFDGAQLGHEGIVHRPVRAAEANREPRLLDAPVTAPLRVRILHRADALVPLTPKGYASKPAAEALIADDLAADVVRLLSSSATLVARAADGSERGREPVRPRHVAVLVPTNRLAALVDDALERAGVPAVINGAGSVFATPAADEWLRLLEALERPVSTARARSAALTSFLGWSAEQMAAADEPAWEELHAKLHRWAGLLRSRGVAALLDSISATEAVPERVLARLGGERRLTDLGHVGQLLHTAATEQQLGVSSLTGLAAAADRRRRPGQRRRGSRPAARLRRRGGPGADDPSQQGPRVPDRLPPVRLAARLHRPGRAAGLPRRPERRRLDDRRRRQTAPTSLGTAGSATASSAARTSASSTSRSPARCTRRPSGGRARTNAATRRSDASSSRATPTASSPRRGRDTPDDDEVVARLEAARRRRRRAGSRSRGSRRRPARAGRASPTARVELDASTLRAHARRALATGLLQRHRLRRARGAGGDRARARRSSTTSLLPTAATADDATSSPDAEEQRLRAAPAPLAAMPGGADVGDLLHRVLEATDFASRRPRRRARRAPRRAATPPRRRHRRHRHRDRRARRRDRDAARAAAGGDPAPRRRGRRPPRRARLRAAARRRRHADGHARPERRRLTARDAPSRR